MALRKTGNKYYAYFRDETGRIITQSTGTGDKAEAKIAERKMFMAIKQRRMDKKLTDFMTKLDRTSRIEANAYNVNDAQPRHARGSIRLDQMFDEALKNRKLSDQYRMFWNHFVEYCGKTYADEVTPQVALDYLTRYYGDKSAKTYNNHKVSLNTIFRVCLVQARLSVSPFVSIADRAVSNVEHHRNLSEDEIQKIMENGSILDRTMTMLSRWTGQRLKDCALMAWNDFDFERKVFLVKPGKTSRFSRFVCVPVFEPLESYLKSIKDKITSLDEPLVKSFDYKTDKIFSVEYKKMLRSIGIEDQPDGVASFHSLRGSFITWAKDVGLSSDIRAAVTGHSSLTVEDIYARSIQAVSDAVKHGVGKNRA